MSALTAAQAAAFAATWAQTEIDLADALGIGGDSWIVVRGSGDGVQSNRSYAAEPDPVTLYVVRPKLDAERQALPGTLVAGAPFVAVGAVGVAIQTDDILVSAADGSAYRVTGQVETDTGAALAPLARVAAPEGI